MGIITVRKFYPLQMYVLDNLANQRLSCSNPKNFNDPFDCKLLDDETIYSGFSERQKNLIKEMHVLCTFKVDKKDISKFYEIQRYFWSFYGDSHKGICIEFDLLVKDESKDLQGIYDFTETIGNFNESKDIYFSGKAEYKNDYLKNIKTIASGIDRSSFSDVLKNIGFTKDDVFKTENEYRIINLEEKNTSYSFFDISKFSKRIIFGNRCNEGVRTLVKAALAGKYEKFYCVNDDLEEIEYV